MGTRGSALALTQTSFAVAALRTAASRHGVDLRTETVRIRTTGDADKDRPFHQIGPKGVFAAELQRALLDGRVDVAVHSLKDLPASEPEGLVLAAVCERGDPRDVLVSKNGAALADLPAGAVVGTSSSRRKALVAGQRPDLETAPLRGNVDTRLDKIARGEVDAGILAAAGLERLGRADAVTQWLDPLIFVPPPGQGAVVVESTLERFSGDLAWITGAQHDPSRRCVEAERAFMRVVEGGCEVPLGAWARLVDGQIVCDAFVASFDGMRFLRDSARGSDPEGVGVELGRRLLEAGAADLRQRVEPN